MSPLHCQQISNVQVQQFFKDMSWSNNNEKTNIVIGYSLYFLK